MDEWDVDPWELMGDPTMFGLDPGIFDNWDPELLGDPAMWGLGGDDPYANWGGGQGGDGTDGSADFGSLSDLGVPSWLAALIKPNQANSGTGGGSGGGGGGNPLSGLTGLLSGLFGGGGGGGLGLGGLGGLLGLGALIGGGINSHNSTEDATNAMLQANQNAQNVIQGQIDKIPGQYAPWTSAGSGAVAQMAAMGPSSLASKYRPLGSGRGITLNKLATGGR